MAKSTLIRHSKELFGVESWVARGVLADEADDITQEDAQAAIAHFLSSAVAPDPAPMSGIPALVLVGEVQPPPQLGPALWIPTEDDPDNEGQVRPKSVDHWQVFIP